MSIDEMLQAYQGEFADGALDDFDSHATIAQEVNLLKQQSSQQLDLALQSEQSLQHSGIDNAMPTESCIAMIDRIIDKKNVEIATIQKSDPQYAKKVADIEKRAKQTKYKAMKNLNTQNEKVPRNVKANMVRRASLVLPPKLP